MKTYLSQQGVSGKHASSPRHSTAIWLSLLSMILIPMLACNLPSRQGGGLNFPSGQVSVPSPELPFPTSEPVSTEVSTLPTIAPGSGESPFPFQGLQTATPGASVPNAWLTPEGEEILPPFSYWTQPGDTLHSLAAHFGVSADQITPTQPENGLLLPGQQLSIPNLLGEPAYPSPVIPDSLVINSPATAGFQTNEYIAQAGGYLSTYREQVNPGEWLTGSEIVQRIATEDSINPQLLLAFLEFRSSWVRGQPADPSLVEYPIGFFVPEYHGLYKELSLVAKELNIGYYGWRLGTLTELVFPSGVHVRISPGLNAGTVAVQNLSSKFYLRQQDWLDALYGPRSVLEDYKVMFGDPWQAAANIEPLFPPGLAQPTLELPFAPGGDWSLTSGPHISWRTGTPRGALDLAPITGEPACAVSYTWVTASAPGLVVRSERGLVAIDLDGDGLEQTGWVLVYLHIADEGRVPAGTWVQIDTPLGHPSCEGGQATGTHVHLTRKYNGEWLAADGPLPMVLSGWVAHEGELSYEGTLVKDGRTVSAHPDGSGGSTIIR